jgi:hypothetical protein
MKTKRKGLNFPKGIKNLIAEKRKHKKNGKSQKIHMIEISWTELANSYPKKLKSSINKFLIELTQDSRTEYSLWKVTKYLKRRVAQMTPIKRTDGRWGRNNLEKANTFAHHLEKRFLPGSGLARLPVVNSNDYLSKIPLFTLDKLPQK